MVLTRWHLLLAIPIPLVRASLASTASLTSYLSTVVPKCAQSCLLTFIAENYPIQVCTPQNFNCLCINPTTSSYTIGEAAQMCLLSTTSCSNQERRYNRKVYEVCATIPGAQPNAHFTPTVSHAPTTTNNTRQTSSTARSLNTTTKSLTSSSTTSRTASSIYPTKTNTTTSLPSSTNTFPTVNQPTNTNPPSDTAIASARSSPSSAASPVLTKPQLAGVIVASIGAAAIAFGFCLLLICCRRRKSHGRRSSEASIIGDKAMDSQGSTPDIAVVIEKGPAAPANAPRAKSSLKAPLTVVPPSQLDQGGWPDRAARPNPNPNPKDIGLALGPDLSHSAKEGPSPITPGSYRTNSQLIPEKPTYSLFPAPLRTGPNNRRASQTIKPPIPPYAPERSPPMSGPRFPSSVDTSQAYMQVDSRKRSLSEPFYDSPKGSPLQGYRGVPFTDQRAIARRLADTHYLSEPQDISPTSTGSRQSTFSRMYPPPLPSEQHYMDWIERSRSRKHPSRKKSTNSSQRTRSTRFSTGSETSFEEIDEDELPAPRSALSPVAEVRSPERKSKFVYPAVPHTAAESPHRVINRPRPTYQNESLIAKRRGEDKAAELASSLQGKRDVNQTAKWKILVSPGLESLNSSNPGSLYTPRSPGKTPPMGPAKSPTMGW